MQHPLSSSQEPPSKMLRQTLVALGSGGPARLVQGLYRVARRAGRRGAVTSCAYCGSGLHDETQNCSNCGAASAPPPAPTAAGPSTVARVATIALWSMGGILGLHCYAAGRHLRGLIYLGGSIAMLFVAMSFDPTEQSLGFNGLPFVWVGIGLTLLWAFDGVQILRGRFARPVT